MEELLKVEDFELKERERKNELCLFHQSRKREKEKERVRSNMGFLTVGMWIRLDSQNINKHKTSLDFG